MFILYIISQQYDKTIFSKEFTLIQLPQNQNPIPFILEEEFDILFYPEVGIDFFPYLCANHRLAPIQIVTWGHSETTGMSDMDYYISSKYFNKESDQKYFSEKLILLNSFGTYYLPPKILVNHLTKENIAQEFDIDLSKNIYNCMQTPMKTKRYEFLKILKRILDNDDNALLIMLYFVDLDKTDFINFVGRNNAHKFKFITVQKQLGYQKLLKISDISIDPYPFGSLNTSLDTFTFNKIMVTRTSRKINGNFVQDFIKK